MSADQFHPGHSHRIRGIESCSRLLHLTQHPYAMVIAGDRGWARQQTGEDWYSGTAGAAYHKLNLLR